MKNLKHYLIAFFFILLFSVSCEKETNYEIEHKKQIILNSIFSSDSIIKVFITETTSPTDIVEFQTIENSNISIYRNNELLGLLDELKIDKNYNFGNSSIIWKYYTNQEVIIRNTPNDIYKIIAITPNLDTCIAITKMPEKPNLQLISLFDCELERNIDSTLSLNANLSISMKKNNKFKFYAVNIYYKSNLYPPQPNKDTTYFHNLNFSIEDPNIYETYLLNEGYIFSDSCFINNEINIVINIDDVILNNSINFNNILIEVKSISEDYYYYQNDMLKQISNQFDAFSNILNVHSNINNGLGVFACYNSIIDTIYLK